MSLVQLAALRRPHPVVFLFSLVVAWLLIGLLAFGLRRGPIENGLSRRAASVVRSSGQAGAEVTFRGQDATVHGTFPSVSAAETARQAVARMSGARSAALADDVQIVPVPAAAAKPLVIDVNGGSLTVTATVPGQDARERLLGAAAAASSGTLTGRVTVDPDVAAPPVTMLADLVRSLTAVIGEHQVTIIGSTAVVEGAVADVDERARLGAAVLAAVRTARPAISLDNRLAVRPVAPDPVRPGDGAVDRLAAAVAGGRVTFATDSSELTEIDRVRLDQIAAALRDGALGVLIAGHTDARGSQVTNAALSLARARAAAAYLASHGVPEGRLRAAGFAADYPAATNDTDAGRAANRRVEISPLAP
ncbi:MULTISPECIES: OmpA family protein [unclassified Frankia]|uniref:OmpA family protein n=2 Tax=Frankia TaxID=1854 RepID=UPI001EF72ADF|nr:MULTISPECIES: OmpA family protein [unclassified Frankia]